MSSGLILRDAGRRWALGAALALAAGLVGCSQPVEVSESSVCADAYMPVVEAMREGLQSIGLRSASAQIANDGGVVCTAYFGIYDSLSIVPIVSASKWLAAATVVSLVDGQHLSLDDSIGKFLPEFKGEPATATVRQLLSHTSGMVAEHPCMYDPGFTLAECIDFVAKDPSFFAPPGAAFAYGSLSFQVAGRVAEVVSGEDFTQLFQERIAGPLHMRLTSFGSLRNPILAVGARSSLNDYGTFLDVILHGGMGPQGRILPEEMVTAMRWSQTGSAVAYDTPRPGIGYSLGAWLDAVDSTTGEAYVITSPGAAGFVPWVDFRHHLRGVFMSNDDVDHVWPAVLAVMRKAREIAEATQP